MPEFPFTFDKLINLPPHKKKIEKFAPSLFKSRPNFPQRSAILLGFTTLFLVRQRYVLDTW